MRLNCILIKISIGLLIVGLGMSVCLTFFAYNTKIIIYLNDILLSIVGGAIIMLLTAIIEYLSFKRKNMENLMKKITEYEKFFFNINYLEEITIPTYDDYKQTSHKGNLNPMEEIEFLNNYYKYFKTLIKNFDEVLDTYINISKINLNDFWDIYGDMKFIFFDKRHRLKLYNELFNYVSTEINEIKQIAYHIDNYKKQNVDPRVIYQMIQEYQKRIFRVEHNEIDDANPKVKNKILKKVVYNDSGLTYIYSTFEEKLDNQYKLVRKLAYVNDKE